MSDSSYPLGSKFIILGQVCVLAEVAPDRYCLIEILTGCRHNDRMSLSANANGKFPFSEIQEMTRHHIVPCMGEIK